MNFFSSNGLHQISLSTVGAKGLGDFKKGKDSILRFFISADAISQQYMSNWEIEKVRSEACKVITQEKDALSKDIKEATGKNVKSVGIERGGMNFIYLVINFDLK